MEAFGVWVEKQPTAKRYMGIDRSTFLFNEAGCSARGGAGCVPGKCGGRARKIDQGNAASAVRSVAEACRAVLAAAASADKVRPPAPLSPL